MSYKLIFNRYYSAEQITVYRSYCKVVKYPKLIIHDDAYNDAQNCSVANIISEEHSNICKSNWLLKLVKL